MNTIADGADPRLELDPPPAGADLELESGPQVARPSAGLPAPIIFMIFAVLAVALFMLLNGRRGGQAEARTLTAPAGDAIPSEPAPPLQLPPPSAPVVQQAALTPPPALILPPAAPAISRVAPPLASIPAQAGDPLQRRRAPAVVVDLGTGGRPVMMAQAGQAPGAPPAASDRPAAPAAAMVQALNGQNAEASVEGLASRLSIGGSGSDSAMASAMSNLGLVIPQGAIIPAVLETAINSDLPGYTRAVVSRDVRSFDGRSVLIPRGSRLIGQYRSAVSLGQSRAFVIWTRVTRPDGVSVQIGSPGTDELGRGGLTGKVDRHFFSRFGGSILLSVLNAGVASIGGTPATQIAIGSPGQAANAAASAQQGDSIPPTIKVAQGEAIRIFVSRDLDFSNVGPAK